MGRLCERPGCSDSAALAYGMRTEDLVFWLDVLGDDAPAASGVLCLRHGDSMTVPRGWTLDDLRDPHLHLFRPPPRPEAPATRRDRRRRRTSDDTGQLALRGLADVEVDAEVSGEPAADEPRGEQGDDLVDAVEERSGALDWKPAFDDGDDLGGLLAARSPLLSRAFRGERG